MNDKLKKMMKMDPAEIANNSDEVLDALTGYADEQGTLDDDILDSFVHDIANKIASGVNNQGTREQIKYILSESPCSSTIKEILETLAQEEHTVCKCGQHLNDKCSIVRTYISKDEGPEIKCMGHYDENGYFEPDERADLSSGRYDLADGSDKCYNCGRFVG